MIRRAQPWLGTMVEISVEETQDHAVMTSAFAEVARVHRLMSFHDRLSDVARINHAAPGELLRVDADTWEVLKLAREIADLSGGAFDIACAPRLVRWGILPAPQERLPQPLPMRAVIALEQGHHVRKLAEGWIDLGGIAKGYAVDLAVDALCGSGIAAGCVNAGGDLRVFGQVRHTVAVRSPHAPGMSAFTATLSDEAMATSGAYFSAREFHGEAVSALVDARDGSPMAARRSASVRAARCVLADALTKVVLATGDIAHPALAACGASAFLI
jgi:thiamine biosynthesis lipoprotein